MERKHFCRRSLPSCKRLFEQTRQRICFPEFHLSDPIFLTSFPGQPGQLNLRRCHVLHRKLSVSAIRVQCRAQFKSEKWGQKNEQKTVFYRSRLSPLLAAKPPELVTQEIHSSDPIFLTSFYRLKEVN